MISDWAAIEATVEEFWTLVGVTPSYPCDLEDVILWSQPPDFRVELQRIQTLSVRFANAWANRLGIPYHFKGPDRRLRGCLLAFCGTGSILIDADDAIDEQRFTVAHELAHYLVDYYEPRKRALQILGEAVRPVLDGNRKPTLTERTHAVLMNVHLGVLGRLMERPDKGIPSGNVLLVEDRADRLALTILAPAVQVRLHYQRTPRPLGKTAQITHIADILCFDYGIPPGAAVPYARELLQRWGGVSVRDWLLGSDW